MRWRALESSSLGELTRMHTLRFILVFIALTFCFACGGEDPQIAHDAGDETIPDATCCRTSANPRPDSSVDPEEKDEEDEDDEEEEEETGSLCAGGAKAWRLVSFDSSSQFGFNLDNHITTDSEPKTPANGCGILDGNPDGIDNAFNPFFSIVGSTLFTLNLQEIFQEAIWEERFSITAYLRGYEEGGANDAITITLVVDGEELPQLTDLPASLEGGKIKVSIAQLPLMLDGVESTPNEDDQTAFLDFPINLFSARLELDEPQAGSTLTGILGGAMPYKGEDGFSSNLHDFLDEVDFDMEGLDLDEMIEGLLDTSSGGVFCDLLSLGAEVRFVYDETICGG